MKKFSFLKLVVIASVAVGLFSGCTALISIDPPATTVRLNNTMSNLDISVGSIAYRVKNLDMYGVIVGDLYFSTAYAGMPTSYKNSNVSGTFGVEFDSCLITLTDNTEIKVSGTVSSGISKTIYAEEANTLSFGAADAGKIFAAYMAKKVATNVQPTKNVPAN